MKFIPVIVLILLAAGSLHLISSKQESSTLDFWESWAENLNQSSGIRIVFDELPKDQVLVCGSNNTVAVNSIYWKNKKFNNKNSTVLLTLVLDCPWEENNRESASEDDEALDGDHFCLETHEDLPCNP